MTCTVNPIMWSYQESCFFNIGKQKPHCIGIVVLINHRCGIISCEKINLYVCIYMYMYMNSW